MPPKKFILGLNALRKYSRSNSRVTNSYTFRNTDEVCCMIRGVPFNVSKEEISDFFRGFNFYENSITIGKNQNRRRTGHVCVLFKSEIDLKRAISEKQGKLIRHRWMELFAQDYKFWKEFKAPQKSFNQTPITSYITDENRSRILVLDGLPFTAQRPDIVDFLYDYEVNQADIVLEVKRGKKTGLALAFMNSNEDVSQAELMLDKKLIGDRYINVRSANRFKFH